MDARKLTEEHIRLCTAADVFLASDTKLPARLHSLAILLQEEHDKEIARLKAQVGSRASALEGIGDTLFLKHGAPDARPVWKEADRLRGIAELPTGVEATNDG